MEKERFTNYLMRLAFVLLVISFANISMAQTVVGGAFSGPHDIVVGPSGNIYATCIDGNGVVIIKPDQSISIFGQQGNTDGAFGNGGPAGIAVDALEKVYVSDRGNNRIQIFDKNGNFLSSQTGFNFPAGIAIAGNGRIVVVQEGAHSFKLLNADFTTISTVGSVGSNDAQFNQPRDVAFDQFGNFFVADYGNNRIQKFDNTGTFIKKFGTAGNVNDGTFTNPHFVTVYNSELYVSDATNRTQVFDLDGNWKRTNVYGNEGIDKGVAINAEGNLLFTSVDNRRISLYKPDGTFLKNYGGYSSLDGDFHTPSGVAYLSNGDFVVGDAANSRVQVFSANGTFKYKFGAGTFNGLGDVDVRKSNDNIYVLEYFNQRVRRFSADGTLQATLNISSITQATRMAVDNDGNIWLTFFSQGKVRKYDGNTTGVSSPTHLLEFGTAGSNAGQFQSNLLDIAVNPTNNNLYVVDASNSANGRIQVFNSSGSFVSSFGTIHNTRIAIDGSYLFSWESSNSYRIRQYDLNNGNLITTASGKGMLIGLNNGINDIEFNGTSNQLYLSDYENNRIQILPFAPEIAIRMSTNEVANNSIFDIGSLSLNTSKDFTFTIFSQGVQPINLTGNPKVVISGANAADFVLDQSQLFSPITSSGTFKVTFTPSAQGERLATLTITNNDGDEGSYVINLKGFGKTAQTISNFDALPVKTYGDANISLAATASSGLPITYQSTNSAVATINGSTLTIKGAGTANIVATQAGDNNYFEVSKSLVFTVNKATLTANADTMIRGYGEPNPPFTMYYTGFKGNDNATVLDTPPTATVAGTATATAAAGTSHIITPSGGSDNNYAFTYATGLLQITKASLEVLAQNTSRAYGDPNPTFSIQYSGFKNGETQSVLTELATATTAATVTSNVGEYEITASGGSAANYAFVHFNGILSITKAPITVNIHNNSRMYGEANPTELTYSYDGIKNGESSTVIDTPPVIAIAASATLTVAAGTQHAIEGSGGVDNNYSFNYVNGSLTITKATLTATAENKTIIFGEALPTFTIVYTGFKNGDTETSITAPTASSSATANANVATYDITLAGGDGGNNYTLELKNGTLTVSKANQTVTFTAIADKTVGDASFSLSATASTALPVTFSTTSDKVTISGTQVTIVKAGRVTITATQAGNSNYNSATATKDFCIKPAKPVITSSFTNAAAPILTSSNAAGNQWFLNDNAIAGATSVTHTVNAPGIYKVQTKVDDCVSVFSDNFSVVITGDIDKPTTTQVSVYPNPTTDYLHIENMSELAQTTMMTAEGRTLSVPSSRQGTTIIYDVNDVTPGIYFVKVTDKNVRTTLRFVKK